MSKKVDYIIEDGAAVANTIEENNDALVAKGMTPAKKASLINAQILAAQKNNYQVKAERIMNEKTAEQDVVKEDLSTAISQVQNAAKSAYGQDKAMLKKFYIGTKHPKTVAGVLKWGEYFAPLLLEHDDELIGSGIVAEDITAFNDLLQRYRGIIATQDTAIKTKNAATTERDEAVNQLKAELAKFRSFIAAAFIKDKAMRDKFKPIPKGRGGSSGEGGDVPPAP